MVFSNDCHTNLGALFDLLGPLKHMRHFVAPKSSNFVTLRGRPVRSNCCRGSAFFVHRQRGMNLALLHIHMGDINPNSVCLKNAEATQFQQFYPFKIFQTNLCCTFLLITFPPVPGWNRNKQAICDKAGSWVPPLAGGSLQRCKA